MKEIGATLREARMRARIDISEIEAETKIRAKYLRALENEEWDLLPGPTFVKTFLRTYAEALGLDAKLIVEEYKMRHERPGEAEHLRPIAVSQSRGRMRAPATEGIPRGYVIGLVVALLVGGLYLLGSGGDDDGTRSAGDETVIPTVPEAARDDEGGDGSSAGDGGGSSGGEAPSAGNGDEEEPSEDEDEGKRFAEVRIVPTGPVYVCLRAAGNRTLVDGVILEAGDETETFRSSQFKVTLGNGNVELRINGERREVPAVAEGVGYEIDREGRRTRLGPDERPTCA